MKKALLALVLMGMVGTASADTILSSATSNAKIGGITFNATAVTMGVLGGAAIYLAATHNPECKTGPVRLVKLKKVNGGFTNGQTEWANCHYQANADKVEKVIKTF